MPLNEGLLAGDGFTVEGGQAVEMGSMGALAGAGDRLTQAQGGGGPHHSTPPGGGGAGAVCACIYS